MEKKGRKTRERRHSPSEERAKLDQQVFISLTENAFEFLERSIQDFEKSPRFSVVHFCAALEMLLKARLMREHWSLIVSKVETANRAKFQQGDFVSVTMEQAVARLREVVGLQLPNEACKSFEAAVKHRNKLIHFFHPDLSGNDNARAQIVSEQGRAWFHLHRLLNEWPEFADFKSDFEKAEQGLRQHRKYLKAKYDALESEIKLLTDKGCEVVECPACGFLQQLLKEVSIPECVTGNAEFATTSFLQSHSLAPFAKKRLASLLTGIARSATRRLRLVSWLMPLRTQRMPTW